MKYIDADHLQKEVKRLERAVHKSALDCADSETRKFHEGKATAYQFVGILIDSLQQEPPINTELCTLIACDIIQATAKRAIDKPQDKDKEEGLMINKMECLNMLEKSFFQKERPESSNDKFVFPYFLYARTIDNKTLDISYAPQSLDAVKYVKNDYIEQPEVDLKEEITSFFSKNPIPYEHITDWPLLKNTALHFYELGLNARKEDK